MQERILGIFERLKRIMTVSGYETVNAPLVAAVCLDEGRGFFHEWETSANGSVLLRHFAKDKNAPTLLVDAHIDTIGLTVAELCGEGFIRVSACGGLDRRTLVTGEIEIFGKKTVRGIFASIPPHLMKNGDGELPEMRDFLVDTGKSDSELAELISVGDPCVLIGETVRLSGDKIASAHLDDKICCAAILDACGRLSEKEISCNVTVLLSAGEETGAAGAKTAAFSERAEGAIALDVNFAKERGVPDHQSSRLGDGAMISRSAVTDKRMTDIVIECAKLSGVPHKVICEACGTGTNADAIEVSGIGTPTAVLSVPIRYMHTPSETCALSDVESVSDILVSVFENFGSMSKNSGTLLGVRVLKGGSEK